MSSNAAERLTESCALSKIEELQFLQFRKEPVTSGQVLAAVAYDVEEELPINLCFFERYVCSASGLRAPDFRKIIDELMRGMIATKLENPDVFVSYAQAAAACMHKLRAS